MRILVSSIRVWYVVKSMLKRDRRTMTAVGHRNLHGWISLTTFHSCYHWVHGEDHQKSHLEFVPNLTIDRDSQAFEFPSISARSWGDPDFLVHWQCFVGAVVPFSPPYSALSWTIRSFFDLTWPKMVWKLLPCSKLRNAFRETLWGWFREWVDCESFSLMWDDV